MLVCANCGEKYTEGLDSCPECGSEKINVEKSDTTCAECGMINTYERDKCQNCGTRLK